jgi:OmpA-OmpF porin, OOP family
MMRKSFLVAGLVCSFVVAGASAATSDGDGTGVYVSGAIGQSQYNLNDSSVSSLKVDKRATSGGISFGYSVTRNIGVEVGYADFGKAKISTQRSPNFQASCSIIPGGCPNVSGDARARAAHMSAMGTLRLSAEMFLYGRLGVARTDREAGLAGVGASDKKTEAIYGVGGGYNFTKNLAGTIEWQKLDNTDVQALNAGVRVSF